MAEWQNHHRFMPAILFSFPSGALSASYALSVACRRKGLRMRPVLTAAIWVGLNVVSTTLRFSTCVESASAWVSVWVRCYVRLIADCILFTASASSLVRVAMVARTDLYHSAADGRTFPYSVTRSCSDMNDLNAFLTADSAVV